MYVACIFKSHTMQRESQGIHIRSMTNGWMDKNMTFERIGWLTGFLHTIVPFFIDKRVSWSTWFALYIRLVSVSSLFYL